MHPDVAKVSDYHSNLIYFAKPYLRFLIYFSRLKVQVLYIHIETEGSGSLYTPMILKI